MSSRHVEDNLTQDIERNTQRTVVDFAIGGGHNSIMEWPWGLLLSDKHHVLCTSDKQRITVGRSNECDIVIDDPRISAFHFAIIHSVEVTVPSAGRFNDCLHASQEVKVYVEDFSSNGTYVNDILVGKGRRCQVLSGDDIGVVAIPAKILREEWEAWESPKLTGISSSSEFSVNEAKILECLPRSRCYVDKFCFQSYQPLDTPSSSISADVFHLSQQQLEEKRISARAGLIINEQPMPVRFRPIRWQQGSPIGYGASSVVYAGIDIDTGGMVALKILQENNDNNNNNNFSKFNEQLREFHFLTCLMHHRIVQCLGVQRVSQGICIILEYVAGGTLRDLIKKFGAFDERVIRLYTLQVLQGMEYLQTRGVVHGDLKSANVLMSEKGNLKITDFGTSRFEETTYTTDSIKVNKTKKSKHYTHPLAVKEKKLSGTPIYMSPELISKQESTFASDVWALGCMVYEMAVGNPPWEELHTLPPHAIVFRIGSATAGPTLNYLNKRGASPALINFLECTFQIDPNQRPSVVELLKHPFISGHTTNIVMGAASFTMFPSTPLSLSQRAGSPVLSKPELGSLTPHRVVNDKQEEYQQQQQQNYRGMLLGGDSEDALQEEEEKQQLDKLISQNYSPPLWPAASTAVIAAVLPGKPTSTSMGNQSLIITSPSLQSTGVEDHKAFVYELSRRKIFAEGEEEEEIDGAGEIRNSVIDNDTHCMPSQRWRTDRRACSFQQKKSSNSSYSNISKDSEGVKDFETLYTAVESNDNEAILGASSGVTLEFAHLTQLFRE